jgi:hypothetical protein
MVLKQKHNYKSIYCFNKKELFSQIHNFYDQTILLKQIFYYLTYFFQGLKDEALIVLLFFFLIFQNTNIHIC